MNKQNDQAAKWIEQLKLTSHPEGGWFAETYRSAGSIPASVLPACFNGPRSYCTAIYFLLEQGQVSTFHRIKSDEIWHFYDGAPLTIHVISPQGLYSTIRLGSNAAAEERFQAVVPAGCWFGAETSGPFSLVGCTVAPGFDFQDFEMAVQSDLTAQFPDHAGIIARLSR